MHRIASPIKIRLLIPINSIFAHKIIRMAKEIKNTQENFDAAMLQYTTFMKGTLGISYDLSLLRLIAEGLGTVIYHPDASLVACSDKVELAHVKDNFLIGTLGLKDTAKLTDAIKKVCTQMGTSNRKKFRTVFYYLLIEELGMQKHFLKPAAAKVVETKVVSKPVAKKKAAEAAPVEAPKAVKAKVEAAPAKVAVKAKPAAKVVETKVEAAAPAPVDLGTLDHHLLTSIAHSVGVNVYTDSTPVDLHNAEERERIKHHFLIGKLGLEHSEHLDTALDQAAKQFSDTQNRAVVYYHLVKHFGKEEAITTPTDANLY